MNIFGTRKIWFTVSGLLLVVSIWSIFTYRYHTGIDFAGGTTLEIKLDQPKDGVVASTALSEEYKKVAGFDVAAQAEGEGRYLVRSNQIDNAKKTVILDALKEKFAVVEELRFESVDPTIGADVVRKAILAVIVAMFGILLYLAYAFRKSSKEISSWQFGVAAVAALLSHDVIILLGIYAILGHFFGAEVDSMFITALLTLIGFSVHDTIVTFDRIRENLRKRSGDDLPTIINDSIVETIVRSISTSFTLFIVLTSMFFFGGTTLRFFILALMIGVVVGTYSSIFIAAPMLTWGRKKHQA